MEVKGRKHFFEMASAWDILSEFFMKFTLWKFLRSVNQLTSNFFTPFLTFLPLDLYLFNCSKILLK